jgi:hypothetical protein
VTATLPDPSDHPVSLTLKLTTLARDVPFQNREDKNVGEVERSSLLITEGEGRAGVAPGDGLGSSYRSGCP